MNSFFVSREGVNYRFGWETSNITINPDATMAIELSISPEKYDPMSDVPVYLILTARFLKITSPNRPPFTLEAYRQIFISSFEQCFQNMSCKLGQSTERASWIKKPREMQEIESAIHWISSSTLAQDIRFPGHFNVGETYQCRHKVPRSAIQSARLEVGEVYDVVIETFGRQGQLKSYGQVTSVPPGRFNRWRIEWWGANVQRRYLEILNDPRHERYEMAKEARPIFVFVQKPRTTLEIVGDPEMVNSREVIPVPKSPKKSKAMPYSIN